MVTPYTGTGGAGLTVTLPPASQPVEKSGSAGEQNPRDDGSRGCPSPVDDAGTVPAGPAVGDVLPSPVRVPPVTEVCRELGDPPWVCLRSLLPLVPHAPLCSHPSSQEPGLSSLDPSSFSPWDSDPLLPVSQPFSS